MDESILIIIDMQNDFVDGVLGSDEAQKIVEKVRYKVANHTGPLIFTKDTHYNDYLKTNEGKHLPFPHCIMGTEGWEIIPELKEFADKAPIVLKNTFGYGSWDKDYWNNILEDYYTIHLCGVCTDICVIANAILLKTMYPNHNIIVDASCCAGVSPERHKAALEVMKSCQIEVENEEG